MSDLDATIRVNLAQVQERIALAAEASGRAAQAVRLVAVTKYVDVRATRAILAAGCRDLGENRPQDLWKKAAELVEADPRWHVIGHLQRNKLRRTLPLATLIHSLDSERLLAAVDQEAAALSIVAQGLLEINISGEPAKHGFSPADVPRALERAAGLGNVRITGLMAMAGLEGGQASAERDFAALRELRDRLEQRCPAQVSLGELSMGMSGDFEIAIRHGATMVRVGSAIVAGLV